MHDQSKPPPGADWVSARDQLACWCGWGWGGVTGLIRPWIMDELAADRWLYGLATTTARSSRGASGGLFPAVWIYL